MHSTTEILLTHKSLSRAHRRARANEKSLNRFNLFYFSHSISVAVLIRWSHGAAATYKYDCETLRNLFDKLIAIYSVRSLWMGIDQFIVCTLVYCIKEWLTDEAHNMHTMCLVTAVPTATSVACTSAAAAGVAAAHHWAKWFFFLNYTPSSLFKLFL